MSSNAIESSESAANSSQQISTPLSLNKLSAGSAASLSSSNSPDGSPNDNPDGDSANSLASNSSIDEQSSAKISTNKLEMLIAELSTQNLKKQFQAIKNLAALGAVGEVALVEFVRDRMSPHNPDEPTAAHGSAYQFLYQSTSEAAKALIEEFPDGLVCPQSDQGIDYSDLQKLLIEKNYQAADKLTNQKLCELAGPSAVARKWVYFTEVSQFPVIDLRAMDVIWGLYSENKFGWSKQQALWTRLGQNWERLWLQLLWKSAEGSWTRYPNEFIWELESAPLAHLPLSNQLRGVRVMNALLCHPAWKG
jgi:hypothetical protein